METISVYAFHTNIVSNACNRGIVIYAPNKKQAVEMFKSFKAVKIGSRLGAKREMLADKVNSQIALLESLIFQNKVYFKDEVEKWALIYSVIKKLLFAT